jgi:hypothetical protein
MYPGLDGVIGIGRLVDFEKKTLRDATWRGHG